MALRLAVTSFSFVICKHCWNRAVIKNTCSQSKTYGNMNKKLNNLPVKEQLLEQTMTCEELHTKWIRIVGQKRQIFLHESFVRVCDNTRKIEESSAIKANDILKKKGFFCYPSAFRPIRKRQIRHIKCIRFSSFGHKPAQFVILK